MSAEYQEFIKLLEFHTQESCIDSLLTLKSYVLIHGIPEDCSEFGSDTLRARVWKLFLGIRLHYDVESYLELVESDHFQFIDKIKDDGFRTFKGNKVFWQRTDESTVIRVLNTISLDCGYVQGVNVLLGPFLYLMPEMDAYYCCHSLLTDHIPRYITKNLDGVVEGIHLLDMIFKLLDHELYEHIILKLMDLRIFSVRYILTLMANTQPLEEVIKLWDAIFAFGAHFNILIFCAYLITLRKEILNEPKGYKISYIIEHGQVNSQILIKLAVSFVPQIPVDIFDQLISHKHL